jgi:UDP-glucose 4-epimerase
MKVLVTGGAGFIGSHVADALLASGNEVVVLDDLSSGRRSNVPDQAVFVQCDVCDASVVRRVLQEHRPQAVSHQAAQISVSASTREPLRDASINVLGSLTLLEECVRSNVERFVFASTGGAIYGEIPDGRADTDWPAHPLSPYACSKLAVEGYLRAYEHMHGMRYNVLRYANVYGPRQDPHGEAGVVAIFCQRLLKGQSLQINARRTLGDEGCVRDYTFVRDVVNANLRAIEGKIDSPIVNVCTGQATPTRVLAEKLARAIGKPLELVSGPPRAGDVERSVLEGGALLAKHCATTLDEGLALTTKWFLEQ